MVAAKKARGGTYPIICLNVERKNLMKRTVAAMHCQQTELDAY